MQTPFHMSNDSRLFRPAAQLVTQGFTRDRADWVALPREAGEEPVERYVPLYEAKMIRHFDVFFAIIGW